MRHAVLFSALLLGSYLSATAAPAPSVVNTVKSPNFVRGAPLPKWAVALPEVPKSDRSDPTVLRMADTQVSLSGEPAILYSRAIQVNDQGSLSEIGQYSINYHPSYQKLLVHKVIVLRDGQQLDRTASVNMRSLDQERALEQGMYAGEVSLQLLMQDVRVGDTLWITYTIEGRNPVFGKRWSQAFGWDSSSPTEFRRMVLTRPKQRPLYWRQIGDFRKDELAPRIEQLGADERLTFTQRAYDAIEDEPSVPSDYLTGRVLQFSEYSDWGDVGQWATGLFPAVKPSPGLKALARTFDSKPTAAAKAAAALYWVQNEVRYFSVSIGENSHRPQAPDAVLANRYGDCKDKSYLLVSLLGMLGIEAKPMLVSAASRRLPARVLASPFWFDHVIVKLNVDGKDYYVDPTQTGQSEGLDDLPKALAGGSGLVVDPKSKSLEKIPSDTRTDPHIEIEEDLNLADFAGDATLTVRRYYRGEYASWARRGYTGMALASLKKHALEPYEKTYPGITLTAPPKYGEEGGRFVITSTFNIPKAATQKNKMYSVPFDTKVVEGSLGIPDKLVRNFPFAPNAGKFIGRYRLRLQWPPEARMNNEPYVRLVDNSYFRAKEEYMLRGNFMDYVLDYSIKQEKIEANEVPDLQAKAKVLNEFVQGTFRVGEASLLPKESLSLSRRQVMPVVLLKDFEGKHEALKDKPRKDISAEQLCGYIVSMYGLVDSLPSKLGDKLAAMDRTLLSDYRTPDLSQCFGYALLVRGMYEESAKAYRVVKVEDDDPRRVLAALAELMAGNPGTGADIMQRYVDKRSKDGNLQGLELSYYAALMGRAGRPVAPELLAEAAGNPAGPWPRAILAMYAGRLSPEQVLAAAGQLPGDARAIALDEAWFHIGEFSLARGDVPGAVRAFRWFPANGMRNSPYFVVAKGELARINSDEPEFKSALAAYEKGDAKSGLAALERSAAKNFAQAQFELGNVYLSGNGVGVDHAMARRWYALAAEAGQPGAQRQLAGMLLRGEGGTVDSAAAIRWYQKAVEANDVDALYELGNLLIRGEHLPQDSLKGHQLLVVAAELGHPKAQVMISQAYSGRGPLENNVNLARYWAGMALMGGEKGVEVPARSAGPGLNEASASPAGRE
jgi:transglutaminase-like putative cysteine protease